MHSRGTYCALLGGAHSSSGFFDFWQIFEFFQVFQENLEFSSFWLKTPRFSLLGFLENYLKNPGVFKTPTFQKLVPRVEGHTCAPTAMKTLVFMMCHDYYLTCHDAYADAVLTTNSDAHLA